MRQQSAAAIAYWWRVSEGVVWRWRKALGMGRTDSPGSRRLIQAASEAGAAKTRGVQLPDEVCDRRSRTALRLNLGRYLRTGYHGPRWTRAQLRLLGTAPDGLVAAQIGRTPEAVRLMRNRLDIPTTCDRRRT